MKERSRCVLVSEGDKMAFGKNRPLPSAFHLAENGKKRPIHGKFLPKNRPLGKKRPIIHHTVEING